MEYVPGLKPIVRDWKWPPALGAPVTMLYAFDLLVQNVDRRFDKPNCAHWGDSLVAYDFELSFSFLLALMSPPPHQVSKCGIAHNHIFQKGLYAQDRDWKPFADKLKLLNLSQVQSELQNVPTAWMSAQNKVWNHLSSAQSQAPALLLELEESLRVQK